MSEPPARPREERTIPMSYSTAGNEASGNAERLLANVLDATQEINLSQVVVTQDGRSPSEIECLP